MACITDTASKKIRQSSVTRSTVGRSSCASALSAPASACAPPTALAAPRQYSSPVRQELECVLKILARTLRWGRGPETPSPRCGPCCPARSRLCSGSSSRTDRRMPHTTSCIASCSRPPDATYGAPRNPNAQSLVVTWVFWVQRQWHDQHSRNSCPTNLLVMPESERAESSGEAVSCWSSASVTIGAAATGVSKPGGAVRPPGFAKHSVTESVVSLRKLVFNTLTSPFF